MFRRSLPPPIPAAVGAFGGPQVLAYSHSEARGAERVHIRRAAVAEVALLVEDAVVGSRCL